MNFLTTIEKLKLYKDALINMGYLAGQKNLSPPIVLWFMSKRCNLSCKHCDFHQSRDKINPDHLMNLARKIAKSDTMVVDFTGGEPFIIPNIQEIISHLKNNGKKLMLNTNGYNIIKHADFLIKMEVDSITVSIDSSIAAEHDTIRGKKGSFEKAIEFLKYIKKNRGKNRLPYIAIRGVVMKDNFKVIKDYHDKFDEIVDEIKFQPIHDSDDFNKVVDKETLFCQKDILLEEEFNQEFTTFIKKTSTLNTFYYRNFSKFIFHPEKMETKSLNHCLPVWMNVLIVNDQGRCQTCTYDIGNLYENEVQDIWSGKKRIGFLRSIAKFGKCKIPCWMNCTSVAPEWQGKILKTMLKVGSVDNTIFEDFKKTSNYTGLPVKP